MQPSNVPLTGPRYWCAISAASIFGVNLGDFLARYLYLGHWREIPVLAALFVVVLVLERRSRPGTGEAYYWIAVLLTRTAATNLADLATHDFRLGYGTATYALLPLLVVVAAFGRAVPPLSPGTAAARPGDRGTVANLPYWLGLFIAEIVGTVDGDAFPELFDLTMREEILAIALLLVGTFALRTDRRFQGRAFYWVTILVIATVGLSVGDAIAHAGKLWLSTLLTGLLFVGVLVFGKKERLPVLSQVPAGPPTSQA